MAYLITASLVYCPRGGISLNGAALLYCEFLVDFDSDHYNHFVWLGQMNLANGNHPEAVANFQPVLEICESDKVWPKESLQPIIDAIKDQLQKLE